MPRAAKSYDLLNLQTLQYFVGVIKDLLIQSIKMGIHII